MGFEIKGYRVIYKGIVYNCINVGLNFTQCLNFEDMGESKPDSLNVVFINQDGLISTMRDKTAEFQFVRAI